MGNSYFTHLECGSGCGAGPFDPRELHFLCPSCKLPMLARYDLQAARAWKKESLAGRPPTMWRYRELMPLLPGDEPVTLGEGFTPLIHAKRLGATMGLERLLIKDESLNPTNSFKARGLSAAHVAREGARRDHGLSAHGRERRERRGRLRRSRGHQVRGLHSQGRQAAVHRRVPPVRRQRHAGRRTNHRGRQDRLRDGKPRGWYDVSTFREAGRCEGKKTMGFELAEQLGWTLPDWIIYPTGGGTGLVGMWKAFEELETIGWLAPGRRPKMVSVQTDGCAPIVRAFDRGAETAGTWENAHTIADGLRVPRAIADFLILRTIRDSGGTAVAVSDDEMVDDMLLMGREEGVSAAPEGAAALSAMRKLVADGSIKKHESVVLFNTGGALKYLDLLRSD